MKRAMRQVATVALAPVWLPCFVVAMAAMLVFMVMFAIASLACPPRFVDEWCEHIFGFGF